MFRRSLSLAATTLGVVAAIAIVPAGGAQADPDDCWEAVKTTYGVHCDGWQITINNDSDSSVWGWEQTAAWPFDDHDQYGVSLSAGSIAQGAVSTRARGTSVITGPQDLFMVLGSNDIDPDYYRAISIWYDSESKRVRVSCGVTKRDNELGNDGRIYENQDDGCSISKNNLYEPITVTMSNMGPRYQKY